MDGVYGDDNHGGDVGGKEARRNQQKELTCPALIFLRPRQNGDRGFCQGILTWKIYTVGPDFPAPFASTNCPKTQS
jgi:hypothetical protein